MAPELRLALAAVLTRGAASDPSCGQSLPVEEQATQTPAQVEIARGQLLAQISHLLRRERIMAEEGNSTLRGQGGPQALLGSIEPRMARFQGWLRS